MKRREERWTLREWAQKPQNELGVKIITVVCVGLMIVCYLYMGHLVTMVIK